MQMYVHRWLIQKDNVAKPLWFLNRPFTQCISVSLISVFPCTSIVQFVTAVPKTVVHDVVGMHVQVIHLLRCIVTQSQLINYKSTTLSKTSTKMKIICRLQRISVSLDDSGVQSYVHIKVNWDTEGHCIVLQHLFSSFFAFPTSTCFP